MEIRLRMSQPAQSRCFEQRDRPGQKHLRWLRTAVAEEQPHQGGLNCSLIWIGEHIPEPQISTVRKSKDGNVAQRSTGLRMTGSSRKPGIVICIPLRKFGNEQVRECAAAVHALVFLLARAGIVKRKIGKMGRAVAGNAIADRLTGRNQAWPCARPREEDSQPGQFLRTKVKTLFQSLEAP